MSEEFNLDMLEEARKRFNERSNRKTRLLSREEWMEVFKKWEEDRKLHFPDWEPEEFTIDEWLEAWEAERAERYFRG